MKKIIFKKEIALIIISIISLSGCYFWRGSNIIIKRYPVKKEIGRENLTEMATGKKQDVVDVVIDKSDVLGNTRLESDDKTKSNQSEYIVGPNDSLSIVVWENPDLTKDEKVEEDGTISYPFIGRVYVAGKTIRQIEEIITELLGKELIYDPQVDITIKDYKSNKVFIVGEVGKPGPYYLKDSRSLFEILSEAGGVKRETAGNFVLIKRKVSEKDDEYSEIKVPLYRGDLERDIEVLPGDSIKVPEEKFFISGEVVKPGFFSISEKDLNLYQAIVVAGGFTKGADKYNVKLSRDNGKEVFLVDVERMRKALEKGISGSKGIEEQIKELKVKDGDMIFVPTDFFYSE